MSFTARNAKLSIVAPCSYAISGTLKALDESSESTVLYNQSITSLSGFSPSFSSCSANSLPSSPLAPFFLSTPLLPAHNAPQAAYPTVLQKHFRRVDATPCTFSCVRQLTLLTPVSNLSRDVTCLCKSSKFSNAVASCVWSSCPSQMNSAISFQKQMCNGDTVCPTNCLESAADDSNCDNTHVVLFSHIL